MVRVPGISFILAPQPSGTKVEVALWSERVAQSGPAGRGPLEMQSQLLGGSAGQPTCVEKLAQVEVEELTPLSISVEPLSRTHVTMKLAPPLRPMPT